MYQTKVVGFAEYLGNTPREGEITFVLRISGNNVTDARFRILAKPRNDGDQMEIRITERYGWFPDRELDFVYSRARDEIQDEFWNNKRVVPHFVWDVSKDLAVLKHRPDSQPI